jgi:lysophospholipid acyltransferase (LPLAT)-like uncharacterized protein
MLVTKTLRVKIIDREKFDEMKKAGTNVIFAGWHQATFVMFYLYRGLGAYIFVTSEVRGQVLGKCAEWLGFKTIPISLEKRLTRAYGTAKLLEHMEKGHDVVIALDGPTGPLFDIKPGIYYLSKKSGLPVFPVGVKASWKLTLFWRWDKYFIPIPFTEVRVNMGDPINPDELEKVDLKKIMMKLSS